MQFVNCVSNITSAEYGIFTAGVSWHGTIDLQWMAWHWENIYGWVLPAVWLGANHWSAVQFWDVS